MRELLRYCTGRATLRAYDSPAHYFEDDKDGVKVREYTMVHMHTCVRACISPLAAHTCLLHARTARLCTGADGSE